MATTTCSGWLRGWRCVLCLVVCKRILGHIVHVWKKKGCLTYAEYAQRSPKVSTGAGEEHEVLRGLLRKRHAAQQGFLTGL